MKKTLTNLRMALTFAAISSVPIATFAGFRPEDLRVNYLSFPLGIDRSPVFSWRLTSDGLTDGQSAYQIEVTDINGDVIWDSGKIDAVTPYGISYEGQPLQSSQRYNWRVRTWNPDGVESSWSDTDFFETALLDPSDWHAQWIEEPDDSACSVTYDLGKIVTARYVRFHATKLGLPVKTENNYRLQLSEIQVFDGDNVISEGKSVTNSASETYRTSWQNEYLTDGITVPTGNQYLGTTSRAFGISESTVDFTIDLGQDMTFDKIVIYPRQDLPAASDSRLVANYPVSYSIISMNASGQEAVLVDEENYLTPTLSSIPEMNPGAVTFAKSFDIKKK